MTDLFVFANIKTVVEDRRKDMKKTYKMTAEQKQELLDKIDALEEELEFAYSKDERDWDFILNCEETIEELEGYLN